jgi:hypothetical protein
MYLDRVDRQGAMLEVDRPIHQQPINQRNKRPTYTQGVKSRKISSSSTASMFKLVWVFVWVLDKVKFTGKQPDSNIFQSSREDLLKHRDRELHQVSINIVMRWRRE